MRSPYLPTWMAFFVCGLAQTSVAQIPDHPDYGEHIQPLLESLCYDCHAYGSAEGGIKFDGVNSTEELIANRKMWGRVWENVLTGTMPPADMPQPTEAERKTLSRWIGQTVFQTSAANPDPGRVTIRRLNRNEYRYTIRDLLGIKFRVEELFPVDDTGYGFDTIGDVLTVAPSLMDKYFEAAADISNQVLESATGPADQRKESYQLVFGDDHPNKEGQTNEDVAAQLESARSIVNRLAYRAFRSPVDKATVDRLLSLTQTEFEAGEASFELMICRALEAILVSPRFLYRAEFQPRPDDPESAHPLDEYSLASRLSYFLWSSLPDEQLLQLAEAGQLRAQLQPQVERMLHDPKSARMVESFVGQWLQIRDVAGIHRSGRLEDAIRHVRNDAQEETLQLFTHIMREDRDVIELLTADYSFLNEDLAKLYDVPGVVGDQLRLVEFEDGSPRGGVLTHASVLIVTSNPYRTSPVKRGAFILDNILGTPSPPPPPNVPPLEESRRSGGEQVSLRVRLERHRNDESCASCHKRMDPLGLGLENFDAIGRWRDEDSGQPIDASSELASGERFTDIRELRTILAKKQRLFYRCLARKLMTYALGRGIEYTDTPTIESIVDAMMAGSNPEVQGRFSTLLMGILQSPQFQMRRGNSAADEAQPPTPSAEQDEE